MAVTSEIIGEKAMRALSAFWKIPIKSDAKFIHVHILFERQCVTMPILQQERHTTLCILSTTTEQKKKIRP